MSNAAAAQVNRTWDSFVDELAVPSPDKANKCTRVPNRDKLDESLVAFENACYSAAGDRRRLSLPGGELVVDEAKHMQKARVEEALLIDTQILEDG